MQALIKNKLLIAIVLLFIVGVFVYRSFIGSGEPAPGAGGESALSIGQDLIALSDQLSRAQLSQELFQDPGYLFLKDFAGVIPLQSFGRPNPFDIIGRD